MVITRSHKCMSRVQCTSVMQCLWRERLVSTLLPLIVKQREPALRLVIVLDDAHDYSHELCEM